MHTNQRESIVSTMIEVKTVYKNKMLINPDDLIGKKIIKKGIYDKKNIEIMRSILSCIDQPVLLDIGANIGNHTVALASYCSGIFAYEPQKEVYSILKKNIINNKLSNVTALNYGISDIDDQLKLYINTVGNNGGTSFCRNLKSDRHEVQIAEVRVGDDVIRDLGIKSVDFIKIDVEGFEAKVISGLKNTIKNHRPFVALEWGQERQSDEDKPKIKYIRDDLFSDYQAFEVINLSSKGYWKHRKGINLMRIIYKFTGNNFYLIPSTMGIEVKDLILIPSEKIPLIQAAGLIKRHRQLPASG